MHWLGDADARARLDAATTLLLPKSTDSTDALPAVTALAAPSVESAPPPPTILIVDDDPIQRLFLTATLVKNGYRVSQASDGRDALALLAAGAECSLVLTDLHMAEMDGDVLIRYLRVNPLTAALPIVLLTGSSRIDKESDLIEIGADDFIRKPVDPARLLARVRAALHRSA